MKKEVFFKYFDRTAIIPFLIEFVAQFIHTYWGIMANFPYDSSFLKNSDETSTNSNEKDYLQNVFMPATQAGFSVFMQIMWSWKLGKAHFNPAVSIGFLVSGKLYIVHFILFVILQCSGSVVAALTAKLIMGRNPGYLLVVEDVSVITVGVNETLMTSFLVFFILCVGMEKTYENPLGPLAIGLTVFQGILSAKAVGIVCISPSNAFGPALISGGLSGHWIFWVFDLLGGAIAGASYMIFFANKEIRWFSSTTTTKNSSAQQITSFCGNEIEGKVY